MKRLLLVLMLLATQVHAASFNFNFVRPRNYQVFPCDQIGTITNGGISATFSNQWSYAKACENLPSDCFCWNGWLVTDKAQCPTLQYGYCRPIYAGSYINDTGWAGRANCYFECNEPGQPCLDYRYISFNPPIKLFSIWVTAPDISVLLGCSVPNISPEYHGPIYSGISALEMVDTISTPGYFDPYHIEGRTEIPIEAGWQGTSNPTGVLTHWWKVTVTSQVPVHRVYFAYLESGPMFWKDAYASTSGVIEPPCPHPPCDFERVVDVHKTSWGRIKSIYR